MDRFFFLPFKMDFGGTVHTALKRSKVPLTKKTVQKTVSVSKSLGNGFELGRTHLLKKRDSMQSLFIEGLNDPLHGLVIMTFHPGTWRDAGGGDVCDLPHIWRLNPFSNHL